MTKLPFFAEDLEGNEIKPESWFTRLKEFIGSPAFLRWAALTSLFMVAGLFITIWILSMQIKSLTGTLNVHDQILGKIAKGELPLLQKEDGSFTSAMGYILSNIKNHEQQINQINEATPTPRPSVFKIK